MFYDPPAEEQRFQFRLRGGAFCNGLQIFGAQVVGVLVLNEEAAADLSMLQSEWAIGFYFKNPDIFSVINI